MDREQFLQQLAKEGILLSERQQQQFLTYAETLIEWNEKMNLTAITALDDIYEKHFYDSLQITRLIPITGTLCDVGSGAGFPGIPLAIAFPELELTIIEPLQKRCRFLSEVVKQLQLARVSIVNDRAETVARSNKKRYNIVTARAVANLPMLAELCIPLVKENGYFIAMKGKSGLAEKDAAAKAVKRLGCEWKQETTLTLSDGATRVNLLYQKVRPTPKTYPRPYAKIKKDPL